MSEISEGEVCGSLEEFPPSTLSPAWTGSAGSLSATFTPDQA